MDATKQYFVFWKWGNVRRSNLVFANSLEEAKATFERETFNRYADEKEILSIIERESKK